MARISAHLKSSSGQAGVELLAALPLVVILGWAVWQAAIAGLTAAGAAHGARVSSRALGVGASPRDALNRVLPSSVAKAARIKSRQNQVTVSLPVPVLIPFFQLGEVSASASFPEQG